KPFEYIRQQVGANSRTGILNLDLDRTAVRDQAYFDLAALRCEFNRVRQQIGKDLAQPVNVAFNHVPVGSGGDVVEGYVFFARSRPQAVDRVADYIRKPHRLCINLDLSGDHSGYV